VTREPAFTRNVTYAHVLTNCRQSGQSANVLIRHSFDGKAAFSGTVLSLPHCPLRCGMDNPGAAAPTITSRPPLETAPAPDGGDDLPSCAVRLRQAHAAPPPPWSTAHSQPTCRQEDSTLRRRHDRLRGLVRERMALTRKFFQPDCAPGGLIGRG